MSKLTTLLASLGLGAGMMYFYDPTRGNRRRALLRDQLLSLRNQADDSVDVAVRDLRNRTRGVLAEAMGRLSEESAPDWLLEERVRAAMGRHIRHSSAIQVSAKEGRITLRGPILADEVDSLLRAVSMTRGVHGVDNQLEVHQEPGNIPALQYSGSATIDANGTWTPAARLVSSVGGGLLALYGGLRRGLVGTALSTVGLGLVARGVTNTDLRSLLGMSTNRQAISLQKAININVPVEELYQFWTNFENLPRFMEHLKEVKDLGSGRSHWVAKGPADTDAEWDAIVTNQVPNELIAWESVAGAPVKTAGWVRFRSNPDGGTRITVQMGYTPPAGALGHAVASMFGVNPKQAMDEDLARLKSLFEQGQTHVGDRKLTGQDLAGSASA